jgi:phenylalanyl-tRNA synthetase beta chain
MKISYSWLKTLIKITLPAEETAALLTSSGLEVEGTEQFETVRGGLQGLVIGQVAECLKHPGADRLSLTKVDIGNGTLLSIVCGAPNVAAGQKVVVAPVGTLLFPTSGEPFEIKKSKIRGELSEGMICAEDEIGLGTGHDGIMILPDDVKTGISAAAYFNIESDTIFEIGLTPNRSDATSHLGVARDLAAVLNGADYPGSYTVNVVYPSTLPPASGKEKVSITIKDSNGCPRYSGLLITGVKIAESPVWLKNRLASIGVKPINNVVDITNFVLHEMGQPLHAFDAAKIAGKEIVVRKAIEGESFITLDGNKRELRANDLMICDKNKPLCIAGVFGGLESGVSVATNDVFLESAYFDPSAVRSTARHHGLKTDASFRFERGTDPEMTIPALMRAAGLILEIAGGEIGMDITDEYPVTLSPYKVAFSYFNCTDLIGKEIERLTIKNIILNQGIAIDTEGTDGLLLMVPRYKTDVTREVDVIEEVMRIYGYDHVEPGRHISYTPVNEEKNYIQLAENRAQDTLQGFGFSEMMGLSLTRESYYPDNKELVKLVNPLSTDHAVLRANMLYSGLEAISYNINRKHADLRLFEIGRTYQSVEGKYKEEQFLSAYVTGRLFHKNPYGLNQEADLPFLKSAVMNLLERCGITKLRMEETNDPQLDYGLRILSGKREIAEIGAVSAVVLKQMDIAQEVFYARVRMEELAKALKRQQPVFEEISRFPAVKRDLALLLEKSVTYQQIEELAYQTERKLLTEVNLFDIYEGEKLGNKRSYAVSFTLMNPEATLTDKQIETVMDKLITGYKEKLGAELR